MIIPAAKPIEETKSHLVRYRVRKGDTLGGVADQFSVSSEDIRKWNGLKTAKVNRGMVLRIYTVGGAPETHLATSNSKKSATKKSTASASKTPQ